MSAAEVPLLFCPHSRPIYSRGLALDRFRGCVVHWQSRVVTRSAFHRALDATFPRRTRIVITHRAGDIEGSDLCWRLDAGRLRPALLVG